MLIFFIDGIWMDGCYSTPVAALCRKFLLVFLWKLVSAIFLFRCVICLVLLATLPCEKFTSVRKDSVLHRLFSCVSFYGNVEAMFCYLYDIESIVYLGVAQVEEQLAEHGRQRLTWVLPSRGHSWCTAQYSNAQCALHTKCNAMQRSTAMQCNAMHTKMQWTLQECWVKTKCSAMNLTWLWWGKRVSLIAPKGAQSRVG